VVEPVIVPRADHPISRRDIDSEALKVLYRLHEHKHTAYLVGGSVRDLMLGRRPKDFDIGTDAHPYQIKKLFRNCWIIGRRFRLAHIKFGPKTIEVATFRRIVPDVPLDASVTEVPVIVARSPEPESGAGPEGEHLIHRDNTFGTPEEDAFRRDFTINALFYDIADFSVIDYVGGLDDLHARVVRSIGDPDVRLREDPVRMIRAIALAARLDFTIEPALLASIRAHRHEIAKSSLPRLLEEYYKILRSGYAEATFRALGRLRLLEIITPELKSPPDAVWDSLARLDRYRLRFQSAPPELTNAALIGSLLAPLDVLNRRPRGAGDDDDPRADRVSFGMLPIARRDLERLRQTMQILPRLTDPNVLPRVVRGLPHRPAFADALLWLEIFGDAPDAVEHWKQVRLQRPHPPSGQPADGDDPDAPADKPLTDPRRRRRRRRGRRRGRGEGQGQPPA
jgi:poly(A) polymerase